MTGKRKGKGRPLRGARCYRGHDMTPENTYTYPHGKTDCRQCARERWMFYYWRRKKAQSVKEEQ